MSESWKKGSLKHRRFHWAMQSAARASDDLTLLKYFKAMFQVFY